jgi:hypothetical protein
MNAMTLYYGAAILTAITNNAASTCLGSLVDVYLCGPKTLWGTATRNGSTVIAPTPPAFFLLLQG